MSCGATQGGRVTLERSDRMWSSGEGNDKPLQYPGFLTEVKKSSYKCAAFIAGGILDTNLSFTT